MWCKFPGLSYIYGTGTYYVWGSETVTIVLLKARFDVPPLESPFYLNLGPEGGAPCKMISDII